MIIIIKEKPLIRGASLTVLFVETQNCNYGANTQVAEPFWHVVVLTPGARGVKTV